MSELEERRFLVSGAEGDQTKPQGWCQCGGRGQELRHQAVLCSGIEGKQSNQLLVTDSSCHRALICFHWCSPLFPSHQQGRKCSGEQGEPSGACRDGLQEDFPWSSVVLCSDVHWEGRGRGAEGISHVQEEPLCLSVLNSQVHHGAPTHCRTGVWAGMGPGG